MEMVLERIVHQFNQMGSETKAESDKIRILKEELKTGAMATKGTLLQDPRTVIEIREIDLFQGNQIKIYNYLTISLINFIIINKSN